MFFRKQHQLKVILTGGPRSGTSFLARLILEMGYHPGQERHLQWPSEESTKGYLEHLKLLNISRNALVKMEADFHHQLPVLNPNWTKTFQKEQKEIAKIVHKEKIDFYKGNRLLVLSDLYHELYPEVKWICIRRSVEATYKSRFGRERSFAEWKEITERRYAIWEKSPASKKALNIEYAEFEEQTLKTVSRIAKYLDLTFDADQLQHLSNLFQPRNKS